MRFNLLICLFWLSITAVAQKSSIKNGLESITGARLQTHINYLASDALMGRNTPGPGLDSAAAYIVREFKKFGVQPVNGRYYQPLPLVIRSLWAENSVEITGKGTTRSLKIKSEFVPFEITANGSASGNVVFAGYGITAPEYNYDDYAGLDVRGKIVVVLRHEPGEDDKASPFKGDQSTRYAFNETKAENAIARGAAGMLLITDPLNHQMMMPRGYPWPSLSKIIPMDALPMTLESNRPAIPVVHAGKEVAELLFGSVDSLKKIQLAIDSKLKPMSREYPDIRVKMKTTVADKKIRTNNVIGIIPGKDPVLRNEYLVIGAHYDHDGFMKNHPEGVDYIFNGADDNASGTAGVLAVAEAFSRMKPPARSVVFMAFSAEEKGLFGSETYVRNPLFPLDKTIAMLNMDMISRNSIDSLYLEGATASPDLTEIVKIQNKEFGFKIIADDKFTGGSDHANFFKHNVPFVFFFSGLHSDYHTVRDNPDKVNPEKAAKVAKLAFKTAWYIANDNKRYKIVDKK